MSLDCAETGKERQVVPEGEINVMGRKNSSGGSITGESSVYTRQSIPHCTGATR